MSRPRRRSSGVEHSLGKGGVGSSILPGGTISSQALSGNRLTPECGDNCANAQKRPSSVRGTSPPEQPELPLAAAPAPVLGHGLRAAHPFPLVSTGKQPERPYTSFRTTPEKAWRFALSNHMGKRRPVHARSVGKRHPLRVGAAHRSTDRRGPQRGPIRGRHEVGWSADQRALGRAACPARPQPGLPSPPPAL